MYKLRRLNLVFSAKRLRFLNIYVQNGPVSAASRRPPYPSATTGFTSSPSPSTRTTTSSPGFSQRGGLRANPTPPGVPVEMMSPGSSVKTLDKNVISFNGSDPLVQESDKPFLRE